MAVLQVFVKDGCILCARSLHLAEQCREMFPALTVEVVDLSSDGDAKPDDVFAVPTFVLNGRVICLGNPSLPALSTAIAETLTGES